MVSKLPFPDETRSADALLLSGLAVIDSAFAAGAKTMMPMLSGGHDSICACHVASQHPKFDGRVHFIRTGIGAKANREFVDSLCKRMGWTLCVYQSPETYEKFVRERGFPGPGRHHWIYVRIKDRCVRQMTKGRERRALVTGCRKEESKRRMGHVEPLKIGETSKKTGKVTDKKRAWTAPCHDWSDAEQREYMEEHDLPRNPLKLRLGMSGECFCGAFAAPNEIEAVRRWVPDVAKEIDRLAAIAASCGKHDIWGTRPPDDEGTVRDMTGELCSNCDRRAAAQGVLFA